MNFKKYFLKRIPGQITFTCALLIFGFLLSIQYNTQQNVLNSLAQQKTEDLTTIVKALNDKRSALELELSDLNQKYYSMREKIDSGQSLYNSINIQLDQMEMVYGIKDVEGPGVTVTITGDSFISYYDIVDIINELWNSGAEAVSVNNVRVQSYTSFNQFTIDDIPRIVMNDKELLLPIVIKAIGKPDILEKGLTFTGGIMDYLSLYNINPAVKKVDNINMPGVGLPNHIYIKKVASR